MLVERIDAVVFDLFNTLLHFDTKPGFADDLARFLGKPKVDVASVMSGVFWEFETGQVSIDERMEFILESLDANDKLDPKQLIKQELIDLQRCTQVYAGVSTTMAWLRAQELELGLCSNANPYGESLASYHNLAAMIGRDNLLFSHRIGVRKPEPEIYQHILQLLGVAPGRCLYVDDGGDRSLWGAKQAGMITVRVKHIDHEPDDYLTADFEINTIPDLLDLLVTAR